MALRDRISDEPVNFPRAVVAHAVYGRPYNPREEDSARAQASMHLMGLLRHMGKLEDSMAGHPDWLAFRDWTRHHLRQQIPQLAGWDGASDPTELLPESVPIRQVGWDDADPLHPFNTPYDRSPGAPPARKGSGGGGIGGGGGGGGGRVGNRQRAQ